MKIKERKVIRRAVKFAERIGTTICFEQPDKHNPFLATEVRLHGYEQLALMEKRSYVETLFLLFQGELPRVEQSTLFEQLMIALINPGPRHPATRAAMTAGVGRTDASHILPIGLNILSGQHLGAGEVEAGMHFLTKHLHTDPAEVAQKLIGEIPVPPEGDWRPAPGFGSRFGGVDPIAAKIAGKLNKLPGSGNSLAWADIFAKELANNWAGWLTTGIAAATLNDLGFDSRTGGCLYQLICAPGLLAHGLELSRKSITAMPFPTDSHYIIEES